MEKNNGFQFEIGYPPTGNHAVIHARGAHFLSVQARTYFAQTWAGIQQKGLSLRLTGRLRVEVLIHPPDRRRRDLDNIWKTAGDACTRAGVWLDDHQIDHLVLQRGEMMKGGDAKLKISVTVLEAPC